MDCRNRVVIRLKLRSLAESLFRLLAVIDVSKEEIPCGYRTFRISHREAANLEPSVNAIRASTTVLNLIDLPGFDATFCEPRLRREGRQDERRR